MIARSRLFRVVVTVAGLSSALIAERVDSDGVPPSIAPPEWTSTIRPGPGAEIVQFIQTIPHDPNPLGVRAAHSRTKTYPYGFSPMTFPSLDGTPLAGRWVTHRGAGPGVVLVHGFTQSKDQKYIVELADLLSRNGWHVLTIDLRAHGESRRLSPAPMTDGWKETEDVLGAVRALRTGSKATSIAVIAFSFAGRSLVKAMARDTGDIAVGIAVTAPLAAYPPATPPEPGYSPSPLARFFLDFLGTKSFYEYSERAARFYGVDLRTLEAGNVADRAIAQVRAPLLMMYALDDVLWLARIRQGAPDGGPYSLAYRNAVQDHPNVRTLLVDRGNHAGMLYLSDPHWFGLSIMSYLKHWQAPDNAGVTVRVPALDILAEGALDGPTATYRFVVRNHGVAAVGPIDVQVDLPAGAQPGHCWLGSEGLGRCASEGSRLTWTLPKLSGNKTTAGPFGATIDVSGVKAGAFTATVGIAQESVLGVLAQQVTLQKP